MPPAVMPPPPSETHLVPPPWTPLLIAARLYVRYGPGVRLKRLMMREWLDVGLRQNPRPQMVVRTRYGTRIRVSTTEDLIMRSLYTSGSWEPCVSAFIAARLKPGDGFLDVGANLGHYSLLASRLVGPAGVVVAIEPAPAIHDELLANLALNQCGNVRPVRVAVTAEPGEITLFVPHSGNLGATTMLKPDRHEAEMVVPGLPLADAVSTAELERARIIKIDVEGAEGTVLGSLARMLGHLRPDCEIVVEVSPERLAASGGSVNSHLAPFLDHGLRPYRLVNSYMPEDYPVMLRRPAAPARIRGPITEQTDLVLSPVDADTLG
ncbi:FkbM family methyltransferase [Streptomyces sp. ISL-98]|uniref:FkbM family methyltransferase n=1 Tax=Streptomyces sp. ISL-98 TaxID=2819192 RepID=UPI001BE87B36|nr:FkbM family methyltransferase [Streptomyces sp. ISL-98]MBT2507091.1 FkbM family methyltransferase [Streptomyces sp. ISL-98]